MFDEALPRRSSGELHAWVTLTAVVALVSGSCGKTMTETECTRVGEHLRSVWDAEVAAAKPTAGAEASERAKLVASGERERVVTEWTLQCRRELLGRRVESTEIDCVLRSRSIADVRACSGTR
jgi:hypothetical protein